jgi:tetratricopeptide (TPR) repeat protein
LRAEDGVLVDIAGLVADGSSVDWAMVESRVEGGNRRLVRHLRLVESITSLHRSIPAYEDDSVPLTAAQGQDVTGPRWGHLVLLDRIGEGTSCEVYRAWDSALQVEVALKLLHDDGGSAETHTRLLEEARRLARVRHAHVVHVYGAEQHDNRLGLWMELVRGESLEHIVKTRGAFGAREAALIGLELCAALAAVHGAGLLHRDIKAQNVMRESGGRLVLMDFGTGEDLAGTNRLVGTPLYLAPEIFLGQNASVQSDIYSVGVLLYYLVTGKFPVSAASMEELGRAHLHAQHQPLRDLRPDLPESFVAVIESALASEPMRRYRTAGSMEAALRDSISVAPAVVSEPVAVERKTLRSRGVAFAVLALALVLAASALIVWTRAVDAKRGTVLTSVRTIAVLPMADVSGSGLPVNFAAGLTDELIATLGQIQSLNVKSGRSVKPFEHLPPQDIAAKLDVDALLETTVLSDGTNVSDPKTLRVRANLIAAGTQTVVRTNLFVRPRGEALALQSDIADWIAKLVGLKLTASGQRSADFVSRTSPAAEEAYLLGRFHLDQYGAGSAEQALKAFERAVELDPQYAAAFAGAARAYVSLGANGAITNAQARAQALAEARRAIELNDNLAEAHAALGHIHFLYDWDWSGADREFNRALELNASSRYARTFYADCLSALGRFDQALVHAEVAKRLDPQSGMAARELVLALYYKRDYTAAQQALQDAMAIEPNAAAGPLLQGRIDEALGQFDAALDETRRAAALSGGGRAPLRIAIIRLEALTGRRDAARAHLQDLQREASNRAIRLTPRDLAYVQIAFGNNDAALDLFQQALDDRDPSLVWLGVDPRVDVLRKDARFHAILRMIGLPIGAVGP